MRFTFQRKDFFSHIRYFGHIEQVLRRNGNVISLFPLCEIGSPINYYFHQN